MFKIIISKIMIFLIIVEILANYNSAGIRTGCSIAYGQKVKVGVLLNNLNNPFIYSIRKNLEEIQTQNNDNVEYTFFDGTGNQTIQNAQLNSILKSKNFDLLILNLVDESRTRDLINKIKENNIPLLLLGAADMNAIESYNKAYWIGTDPTEGGILVGKILVNLWTDNKKIIDKNGDNIMQYIMLEGPPNNIYTTARTKYPILSLNNSGIQTQKLQSKSYSWGAEGVKDSVKTLLLQFGPKIEMIIANNDAMAIAAIKALQEYGYNNQNSVITIPVVGFDGIPDAQNLIKDGIMTATVIQNSSDFSKALYSVGMNLTHDKKPLEDTPYHFDDTGTSIVFPLESLVTPKLTY